MPSPRSLIRRLLIPACGCLCLTLAAPLPAQNEQPGVFGEVIDVRVVNLEVVATDKDGVRVSGLQPDDFVLTVDGREVPIEYFTEVLGGTAVARGDEAATATLPALAPGRPVGTSYLVFIDEYFSISIDRNRTLDGLIEQLPLLNPEDRMAVVAFDGRGLEMLSTWSQSIETLERVLKRARDRPTYGLQREAEMRSFESTRELRIGVGGRFVSPTAPGGLETRLDVEELQQLDILSDQLRRVVLAGSAALRSFAAPPGRKVMLLLSGGWPYNPAQWVVNDPSRPVLESGYEVGEDLYQPLIQAANRLSYTLYPVDVPALSSEIASAAEASPSDGLSGARLRSIDREQEIEATLSILARETGGRAAVNAASTRAFERAVEDTRSYYWLGFTPTWEGDDEKHDVRVRSRRKGIDVRSRGSFSDLSRTTEVSMMVESTLLFGNAPGSESLGVELGTAERAGRGKVSMPMTVLVPTSELTFLPKDGSYLAQAELRVAVLDEDGNSSEIPVIPLVLKSSSPPKEGEVARYRTAIKLRKKKHDLVVSLYDQLAGTILTQRLEVDPRSRRR